MTDNNRGEGMPVDFATLLRHVDEQIENSARNLTAALKETRLDFREQNYWLGQFQAAVRAREVLLGRVAIDGHGVTRKSAIEAAGTEAVAAVLGRRPVITPGVVPAPPKPPEHDDGAAALAKKLSPEKI